MAIRWEPLQHHSKALLEFHGALLFFLREGTDTKRHINWRPYNPNIMPNNSTDVEQ